MSKNVDYLIVGQGIAGTLLSYFLIKKGKTILVIDELNLNSPSYISGAIINPIRKKTWNATLLQNQQTKVAVATFQEISSLLKKNIITQHDLCFFLTENELAAFEKATKENPNLHIADKKPFLKFATLYDTTPCIIHPAWQIDSPELLSNYRAYLHTKGALLAERFEAHNLVFQENAVSYKDINAQKIIFCNGTAALNQAWFEGLPFTKNSGEALTVHIPNLPQEFIYNFDTRLIPRGNGNFWVGSNYTWEFDTLIPNEAWKQAQNNILQKSLQVKYKIIDHQIAQRPTTAGQIPFIGLHPQNPLLGIFNGLGTKGYTEGPYWAQLFSEHLINDLVIESLQTRLNYYIK